MKSNSGKDKGSKRRKKSIFDDVRFQILIGLCVAMLYFGYQNLFVEKADPRFESDNEVAYSDYMDLLNNRQVDTVFYKNGNDFITYTLKSDAETAYKTPYPDYDDFRKDVLEKGAKFETGTKTTASGVLGLIVTVVIYGSFIVFMFMLIRNNSNPGGKYKITTAEKSDVKFKDVIGQDEVIEDVRYIAELIKNPDRGDDIGVTVPKGLLLSGSPGCGKTLIAKAIAGEAGVPFIYINASSIIEMFVGVGARRVREIFKKARAVSPCVVFIDEIDAIGEKRSNTGNGGNESTQTLNALLQEMDGFKGRDGVFIIAATNRPDALDDALVRAGRFDRQVIVMPPKDSKTRAKLFRHYLEDKKVADDVDITNLSRQCQGFTGADISAICNEAGMIAILKKKDAIDSECMEEAIDRKVFKGDRQKKEEFTKQQERDRVTVAYHEAGHAVMTILRGHKVARASIIGTTSGVGGAVFKAEKDGCFVTKKELIDDIMIAYAGRASEEIKFDDVTSGASNDISQATGLLMTYVKNYGFDEDTGLLDVAMLEQKNPLQCIDINSRLKDLSKEIYKDTVKILTENYDKVEAVAKGLIEDETLSGETVEQIADAA